MKTWLKGGLIGLGIYILLLIILFFTQPILMLLISLPGIQLSTLFFSGPYDSSFQIIISMAFSALIYFLIGALIGLLISKFKKSSQKA